MANFCYNRIKTKNRKLKNEFKRVEKLYHKNNNGIGYQLFNKGIYLFELESDGDDLKYETKWSPNTEDIKQLSNELNFDYEHYYEELVNQIMGEIKQFNGNFYEKELTDDDFNLVDYDEESNLYSFNGKVEEFPDEFYQEMLNNKEWEIV